MLEQTSNVLPPVMSADCLATCDGRPVVSRTRGPVGSRIPHCVPSLFFDARTMAPENRPLPAILHAHLSATSTDYPAVSDGGGGSGEFLGPLTGGQSTIALP